MNSSVSELTEMSVSSIKTLFDFKHSFSTSYQCTTAQQLPRYIQIGSDRGIIVTECSWLWSFLSKHTNAEVAEIQAESCVRMCLHARESVSL